MSSLNSAEEDHNARSDFIRKLVQSSGSLGYESAKLSSKVPKKIVQFWHDLNKLPADVAKCIDTWKKIEEKGFNRLLFDKKKARDFIRGKLGTRYKNAYDMCYHPAMHSDYFRLCYIFVEGGCYIDTDDVYDDNQIQHLFSDCRLKIQPLCYDKSTHMMVPPSVFTKPGAGSKSWIFYLNNNPLIACPRNPLIERALTQATLSLEKDFSKSLPEIQSATGPGNLTKTIFTALTERNELRNSLHVVNDWENIVKSKWQLSYRNDTRNWRLSNRLDFKE